MIDLTGSERIDKPEVTEERHKEEKNITKYLSSLKDVIFSLANKSAHVPYPNRKLAQIL